MRKATYPTLADAIGAFVAGEFVACSADPKRIMLLDEDKKQYGYAGFDLHRFEHHLCGLISDLVYCCGPDGGDDYVGAVVLCYATAKEINGTKVDWQKCAQGYARIEPT